MPIIKKDLSIGSEFIIFSAAINLFSLSFILYLSQKSKRQNIPMKAHRLSDGLSIYYYFILLGLTLFFYGFLVISVYGVFNLSEVFNDYARFYALSKRGTAWVFSIFSIISNIILFDFYFNGITKKKLFIYISILFVISLTGGRATIITYLIIVVFINGVIHRKKVSMIPVALSVILITSLFIFNSASRHGTDIITYLSKEKTDFDFDQAFVLEDTIEFITEDSSTYYLVDFLEIKYMFIPRAYWPDKPLSTVATRLVYPEIGERGSSVTFGIYANAVLNLGYLSLLYIPLFFLTWNYLYFIAASSLKPSGRKFAIILFSIMPTQIIRGGSIDMRLLRVIVLVIIAYYSYKYLTNSLFKNNKKRRLMLKY